MTIYTYTYAPIYIYLYAFIYMCESYIHIYICIHEYMYIIQIYSYTYTVHVYIYHGIRFRTHESWFRTQTYQFSNRVDGFVYDLLQLFNFLDVFRPVKRPRCTRETDRPDPRGRPRSRDLWGSPLDPTGIPQGPLLGRFIMNPSETSHWLGALKWAIWTYANAPGPGIPVTCICIYIWW